jgi:hypothetical protein
MTALRGGAALVGAIVAWFFAFTFEASAAWMAGLSLCGAGLGWVLGGRRPDPAQRGMEPGAGAHHDGGGGSNDSGGGSSDSGGS